MLLSTATSSYANKNAEQRMEKEVAALEEFESSNENLIARDDLPCEADSKFQLQCSSVRRIVRSVSQSVSPPA